jgi:two-component system LytT family sensor kinase
LEIEQFRHEGQLQVSYQIDPECLTWRLPTMILQPIAENAIRHGFRDKFDSWRIAIEVTRQDDLCQIRVSDNGGGIPPGKIDSIFQGEGHGLKNVSQRLNLYYGSAARIHVYSTPKSGTYFTLIIPRSSAGPPPHRAPDRAAASA